MTEVEWLDSFEVAEQHLLKQADVKTNRPGMLPVMDGVELDVEKLQMLVVWLTKRGWQIVAEDGVEGPLSFYAPGPMTSPGAEAASRN
jgi:hypothetical protein